MYSVVIVVLLSIVATIFVMRMTFEPTDETREVITSAPFELFHNHARAVQKTVECMSNAINEAASGKDASKSITATIAAELEADNIKSEIQGQIGTGVRFVIGRATFLHMLSRQDRIADYAQNVAEQLSFRELYNDENNDFSIGENVSIQESRPFSKLKRWSVINNLKEGKQE